MTLPRFAPGAPLALLLLLGAAACGGAEPTDADAQPDATVDAVTDAAGDADDDLRLDVDAAPDTDAASDAAEDGDLDAADDPGPEIPPLPVSCEPQPFEWPTGPAPTLTPDASWAETLDFGWSPFAMAAGSGVLWVKFIILLDGTPRIVFQKGTVYLTHSEFARARLDPFVGMSPEEFDAVSLRRQGQRALLGAVLMPLWTGTDEFGVQLVGVDPYPAEMVAAAIERVRAAVKHGKPLDVIYVPTADQAKATAGCPERFEELGVKVASTDRWTGGLGCYSQGWALGRLVAIEGAEIPAAFANGTITTDDILLTRDVPADLPPVAGLLTTAGSAPSSQGAILANTYGIPYALLALDDQVAAAKALVGRTVVLSAAAPAGGATCEIGIFSVDHLSEAQRAELDVDRPPLTVAVSPKEARGALAVDVDGLLPADSRTVGRSAAYYGVLRASIPEAVRPARALTFDLWDAYMAQPYQGGTLGGFIADSLAPHGWPADVPALAATLADIRAAITDEVDFADADKAAVSEALGELDTTRALRFRSSTNAEDIEHFTGAGLYASSRGCPADDADGDEEGPSRCDAADASERSVWRAIREVYASFYDLNATMERLRRGVDEAQVGMGLLVYPEVPEDEVLANGLGLEDWELFSDASTTLTTQVGSRWVSSAEPGVVPESVLVNVGPPSGVVVLTLSSLMELGLRVFSDVADYVEMATYLEVVRTAMVAMHPGALSLRLEFEYASSAADGLVVEHMREVGRPAADPTTTVYLVDDGPLRRCTFEGEFGEVFANHRLKSRWTLSSDDRRLTEEALETSFYDDVSAELVVDGERVTLSGPTATWPQATHEVLQWKGPLVQLLDGVRPEGLGGSVVLVSTVTQDVLPQQGPAQPLSGVDWTLQASWDEARPRVIYGESGQRVAMEALQEEALLGPCPEDVPEDPADELQTREFVGQGDLDGVTVRTRFYWPPTPTGAVGGYTAPLRRWVETTIEGLTTQPLVLTDWFAQTYRPEHRNLGEHFIFEPRMDPGTDPSALAELEALGVVMIYASGSPKPGEPQILTLYDAAGQVVSIGR
ncbi:MAG: hypothetical protein H6744_14820 [Deltaproteobacteria bacterium]|nr:hypothetical protein [Deltaproteobacteria bacterium]